MIRNVKAHVRVDVLFCGLPVCNNDLNQEALFELLPFNSNLKFVVAKEKNTS